LWSHAFTLVVGIVIGTFGRSWHHLDCLLPRGESARAEASPLVAVSGSHAKDEGSRYDLLPVLLQDVNIGVTDIRMVVTEAIVRVNFVETNSSLPSLSIGTFHLIYPGNKPDIGEYYRKVLSDLDVVIESFEGVDNKRQMLYSPALWDRLNELADKVFFTDMSAALCSNPTTPIVSFARDYDWIGSAFFFAEEESSPFHRGGNGAVSIRSPKHLKPILQNSTAEELANAGNDDMWYVERLGRWEKSNITLFDVAPPKLPSWETQRRFGVEVVPSPPDVTPTAIYHLMIIMPFADRERMISICPEAKRLYPSLHEPTCALLECPQNMSYNMFEWNKRKEEDPNFDKCSDMCHAVYHPVGSQASMWANSTKLAANPP